MKALKTIFLLATFAYTGLCFSQSTSVFDASYFEKDNTAPPLKIGKGFHINDVYKQTRSCFTTESSKASNLTAQQVGGKKTSIKLYHTTTNVEYNILRKSGASGKVSFLNLFSFGGSKLEEYADKEIEQEEKVVFAAHVDFGNYSFEEDPKLTDEAKALIDQKKLREFVNLYGTHYISGIKKQSAIYVVLTKAQSKSETTTNESSGMEASANHPQGWKGSMQAQNTSNINNVLQSGSFTAEIEIYGPSIDQNAMKGKISAILGGNSARKADAIYAIIESALVNISDPNTSNITQYFYSPFSLYGLDGIYWDEKKQNELQKLNEAIVSVYSAKSRMAEMVTESGKQQYIKMLKESGIGEEALGIFIQYYEKARPTFTSLTAKAQGYLNVLESRYNKCADVYCANTSTCCTNDEYIKEIENYNLNSKIENEEERLLATIITAVSEISAPECEKKKMGTIKIINRSSNPYSLYQGDKFIQTIGGGNTITFTVPLGDYQFKAVQDSGYLMYATVNQRTASIKEVCEEFIIKIGFED